jgi:hypothetical protein
MITVFSARPFVESLEQASKLFVTAVMVRQKSLTYRWY